MAIIDFSFLGIIPMKDVILHHPNWKIHCGEMTMQSLEYLPVVKFLDWMDIELAIEAIPKKLTDEELAHRTWCSCMGAGFEGMKGKKDIKCLSCGKQYNRRLGHVSVLCRYCGSPNLRLLRETSEPV